MGGLALFCILAVILLLVILLVVLLKQNRDDGMMPPPYDYTTPAPAPAPPETKPAPAKVDEQSYYQFSGSPMRQCAFCGCENETGATKCQVCGNSL